MSIMLFEVELCFPGFYIVRLGREKAAEEEHQEVPHE
jgi:hypothetical protein